MAATDPTSPPRSGSRGSAGSEPSDPQNEPAPHSAVRPPVRPVPGSDELDDSDRALQFRVADIFANLLPEPMAATFVPGHRAQSQAGESDQAPEPGPQARGAADEAVLARCLDAELPPAWSSLKIQEIRRWSVERTERTYLDRLLRDESGQLTRVAKRAGICPRALYDRMKKYDLKKERYK